MPKTTQLLLDGSKISIGNSIADTYTDNIQAHANALTPLFQYARNTLKDNDIVFDVGANIGLTTIGLARIVPNGKVFAFEPSKVNAERLRENLFINNVTNIEVVQAAVSSQSGGLHFVESAVSGSASHARPSVSEVNVQTVALDDYRNNKSGAGPALIKIDVEGHEPWVLDSGLHIINEFRPKIWMEFNSWCLMAFGSVNPLDFAETLFSAYSVKTTSDGKKLDDLSNHVSFTHDNIILHHCVTDLILQLQSDIPSDVRFAPTGEPGKPRDHTSILQSANALLSQRCAALEKEVTALKTSTSWRITRPLRAIKRKGL